MTIGVASQRSCSSVIIVIVARAHNHAVNVKTTNHAGGIAMASEGIDHGIDDLVPNLVHRPKGQSHEHEGDYECPSEPTSMITVFLSVQSTQ